LIDEKGKQLGIVKREEALSIAQEKDLDLVEVSPNSRPPVCRILNYDKFRYQLSKKEKKQKVSGKKTAVKGVRIGVKTGAHDMEFKKKNTFKFLNEGKKVRVELVLRGREKANRGIGRKVLEKFIESLGEKTPITIEQPIQSSPRGFICVVFKK